MFSSFFISPSPVQNKVSNYSHSYNSHFINKVLLDDLFTIVVSFPQWSQRSSQWCRQLWTEGWSRAARPLMWTWMRLSHELEAKINKDHAVELNILVCFFLFYNDQNIPHFYCCPSLIYNECFCPVGYVSDRLWLQIAWTFSFMCS